MGLGERVGVRRGRFAAPQRRNSGPFSASDEDTPVSDSSFRALLQKMQPPHRGDLFSSAPEKMSGERVENDSEQPTFLLEGSRAVMELARAVSLSSHALL